MCPSSFLRLVGLGPFLVFALAATAVEPVSSHKDLKLPPLNSIQVPEPERVELPNGMVLHILEDHELPLINLTALIRVGSRWEPSDQAGLASMVGSVMRTGGTPTRNGDQLDDELDQLGASVETWISEDSGGA
ncbi:MAG TPA: insulinase family protein, partial [Verrucomicrobiota bacterium]|nr:insulinase family protein [Verrucomicrobiota bacterium]